MRVDGLAAAGPLGDRSVDDRDLGQLCAGLDRPRDERVVLLTDEVRDADDYFAGIDAGKPDTKSLKLMRAAMAGQTVDWSDKLVQDQLQERLRRLIARRRKSAKPAAESTTRKPSGNVISIMDALRKSLASESRKKR